MKPEEWGRWLRDNDGRVFAAMTFIVMFMTLVYEM